MASDYRLGVIGVGYSSTGPLPTIATYPGVTLAGICARRMQRAQAAADEFGAEQAFDDYQSMFAQANLNIVYISAPVKEHFPIAKAALEAGIHVLCEKPLAMNATEAKALAALAKEKQLINAVAFNMRSFPANHTIGQLISEGKLGALRHASINLWISQPPSAGQSWNWFHQESEGGGLVMALACHYIDLIHHWFGPIESVQAQLRTWNKTVEDEQGTPQPATADDALALMLNLPNGGVIQIHISGQIKPGSGARLELYGEDGSIVLDGISELRIAAEADTELQSAAITAIDYPEHVQEAAGPPSMVQGYRLSFGLALSRMIEAIEGGEQANPDFADGHKTNAVIDAIKQANREQRTVAVSYE